MKDPKERSERLKAILRLIRSHRIESQESLLKLLESEGFELTQATLSRDLKALKVGKISAGASGYYYSVPSDEERRETEASFIQDFLRGYVSVDWNPSLVVVHTFSGHSSTVALALDNLGLECSLGTLAGQDNAVFIALRQGYSGEDFVQALKKKIPNFELD
jgi:transcriptional regulator of arginine metabolism